MIQNLNKFTFAAFGEILPDSASSSAFPAAAEWTQERVSFSQDEVWVYRADGMPTYLEIESGTAALAVALLKEQGAKRIVQISLVAAPAGVDAADPAQAVAALNAGVEAVARREFAQYQWTYKRYTLRPPGSGEENPYWDLYR